MSFSIHLKAQDLKNLRSLNQSTNSLAQTLENLSAGVHTKASDLGGATLAIHERFSSDLLTAKAELRTLTTNTSLLQTLDSAFVESTDKLHTMRELALSVAGSHLSLQDRETIEQEFRKLIDDVYEVSESTTYNGRHFLNGNRHQLDLSLVSEQKGQSTASKNNNSLYIPNLNPKYLGKHVSHVGQGRGVFLERLAAGDLSINGVQIRGSVGSDDPFSYAHNSGSAIAKAQAINAISHLTGVHAEADINLYRGFEVLKGRSVQGEAWLSINGHKISGFDYEDMDASSTLRRALNSQFKRTGVMASIDQQGQLILAAPDGRNITIEFSDVELRNALGIRDLYGDEVNFSPDVDPPEYIHHGDITSVAYVSGGNQIFNNGGGNFVGTFNVLENKFTKPQDGVDYIFEVVEAGTLGQAKFRVKEESISDGVRDDQPEDYLFNEPGIELTPPAPNKVRIEDSGYLGASQVRIGLRVVTPGSADSHVLAEQPEVEVLISSLDDETVNEHILGTFKVSNHSLLDLTPYGLDVKLRFPVDERRYLLDSNGQEISIKQNIPPTFLPDDHDYDPQQPYVASWDGIHTTNVKVEVIESGHSLADRDYSYTDETPAKIRVTAELPYQNRSIVNEYTLDEFNGIYQTGIGANGSIEQGSIGLVFPSTLGKASVVSSRVLTGEYNQSLRTNAYRFVGEDKREYEITLTSDGIMTYQENDGGPSAEVKIYEFDDHDQRVLVQNYTIDELNTDRSIHLGQGDEQDAFIVSFRRGPNLTSVSRSRDLAGSVSFNAARYNVASNETAVVRITKAGIDTGPNAAEYEYYYTDDPQNILGTGVIGKYTNLPDQTQMRSHVRYTFRPQTPNVPNNIGFIRDFSYSLNKAGSFYSEVIEQDDTLMLQSTWHADTRHEQVFLSEFHIARYMDVGNGVSMYLYRDRFDMSDIDPIDIEIEGSVSAVNSFQVGDEFSYEILPNIAKAGDQYNIIVNPVDLAAGAEWNFQAVGPDWKPNDVYYAHVGTGFDANAFTITDTLNYPFEADQDTLGTIEVSGHGRFEVGDQIRVGTRGFVGDVKTTGAYTNPAFPTDYILKVTKGGNVNEAELSWRRADGLTDTEFGGQGVLTGLQEGQDAYLEEGVYVSLHDVGQGAYLAEDDEIYVSVGQNLLYTFGGQVSLYSSEDIELQYADATIDRQLGKVLFTGSDEEALSPKFHDLSMEQSTITAREDSSLAYTGLMSQSEVHQAIRTIDVALEEIGTARASLGASMSRLSRQHDRMTQKVHVLSGITERLVGVDYARAIATRGAEQIKQMSMPRLMQLAQVNALRVLDLINQPALSVSF